MKQYLDSRLAYMKVANNSAEVLADEDDGGVFVAGNLSQANWFLDDQKPARKILMEKMAGNLSHCLS